MTRALPGAARTKAGRSRCGQSMAEFALVLPLFMILIFGLIDGGRLVYINNAAAQAAREGARWGSVRSRAVDAAGREAIKQYTLGTMNGVPTPNVTVRCERDGQVLTSCGTNDILVVKIESAVSMATPFVERLFGRITVSATSKVVVNQ